MSIFTKIQEADSDYRVRAGKLNSKLQVRSLNPQDKAMRLLQAKNFTKSLIKVHGLFNFSIEYAGTPEGAHAYADKDHRKIVLGAHVIDEVDPEHFVQVSGGLGLHEAGHFEHSDWLYAYIKRIRNKAEAKRRRKDATAMTEAEIKECITLRNVVEDCRMEDLVVEESPGFDQYIGAARKHLFVNPVKAWEKQCEALDKREITPRSMCLSIVFQFFRCPNHLTQEMKEYELEGVCPFDYLNKYADNLRTEEDAKRVSDYVQALVNMFSGEDPNKNNDANPQELQGKSISMDQAKASQNQKNSDTEKQKEQEQHEKTMEKLQERLNTAKEEGNKNAQKQIGNNMEQEKKRHEKREEELNKLQQGSFDISQMEEKHNSPDKVQGSEVQEQLQAMTAELVSVEDNWDWDSSNRNIITKCPKKHNLSKDFMKEIHDKCKGSIKKLSKNLMVRLAEIERRDYGLREGNLSRRHLATAKLDGRPFYRKETTQATGVSICLLLDESGSMSDVQYTSSRARQAMESGYIISEALKKIPRVDMFAYSHTSGGNAGMDCVIKKLIHPNLPTPGMAGYDTYDANCNYDHAAIEFCAEEFRKDSLYDKKIFICIADGQPAGRGYGGRPAKRAVRETVKKFEKKGMTMIQIGIGGHVTNDMFTDFIEFDERTLVKDLSKMIQKIILKNSK